MHIHTPSQYNMMPCNTHTHSSFLLTSMRSYPIPVTNVVPRCFVMQGTYIGMYGHTMWDVACLQPQSQPHSTSSEDTSAAASALPPPPSSVSGHHCLPHRRDLFADREERDYRASREQDERHRRRGGDGDLGGGRGGKVYRGAYWNTPAVQSLSAASSAVSNIMQQQQQQQQQSQSHVLGTGPGRGLFQDLRVTPRATRYANTPTLPMHCKTT